MIPRIVLIVLALVIVWRVLAAIGKRASASGHGADSFSRFSPQSRRRRVNQRRDRGGEAPEELVPCAGCGTFVPGRRALVDADGRLFCSDDCRRLGAGGGDPDAI